MSKITDSLLPEDFGKSFDEQLFAEFKQCIREQEQAGIVVLVLYFTGFISLIGLGGLVGIGLFFVLSITGIAIALPKQRKRKKCQDQLGVSNQEFRAAVQAAKKRING